MIDFKILRQYLLFIFGLFLMGLGISLIVKADLGTSPISTAPYVLSLLSPVTFGVWTFLNNFMFWVIQIFIMKKEFPKAQWLQVPVAMAFGAFVDLGMFVFGWVHPVSYPVKIISLVMGCTLLASGIHWQVAANCLVNPGEGLVKTIAQRTGKEFGSVKICFDATLVFLGIIISLWAFGTIKGVREGTLISTFLVGFITRQIGRMTRVSIDKS
jgi:uncharacterized membrane protein YczE